MTTTPQLSDRVAALSAAKQSLLAQRLRRSVVDAPAAITARAPDHGDPPLSYAQERLWFMERFVPGTAAYTIPAVLRIRGPLEMAVLARTLDEIVARHESLRMRFDVSDDGDPTLTIDPPAHVDVEILPVEGGNPEDQVHESMRVRLAEPFDLATGPLLRVALARLDADEHVLMLAIHHIVCDGWSVDVLVSDFVAIYDAFATGQPNPLPPLVVQYGDYAIWQRAQATGDALARPCRLLAGAAGRARPDRPARPTSRARSSKPSPAPRTTWPSMPG